MSIKTYAGIKDAITRLMKREGDADFAADLPVFIALAHADIEAEVEVRSAQREATLTLVDNKAMLPSDYESIISVVPEHAYSIFGNVIEFASPAPSAPKLLYHAKLVELVNDTDTNIISEREPALYIYAACIHASPAQEDDERVITWGAQYQRAVERLNAAFFKEVGHDYSMTVGTGMP